MSVDAFRYSLKISIVQNAERFVVWKLNSTLFPLFLFCSSAYKVLSLSRLFSVAFACCLLTHDRLNEAIMLKEMIMLKELLRLKGFTRPRERSAVSRRLAYSDHPPSPPPSPPSHLTSLKQNTTKEQRNIAKRKQSLSLAVCPRLRWDVEGSRGGHLPSKLTVAEDGAFRLPVMLARALAQEPFVKSS